MASASEPRRKDAVRNRERLLAAAEIVFARDGLDATLDDVAREAGVGVGTAYRHFRNKQELASEVLGAALEQLTAGAELALTNPDPWDALATFITDTVANQSKNRGLHHYLLQGGSPNDAARTRLWHAVSALTERAIQSGTLRADFAATDLGPLLVMMRPIIDMSAHLQSELWRRYLALLLDGVRAGNNRAQLTPGLPLEDFDRAMKAAFQRPSHPTQ